MDERNKENTEISSGVIVYKKTNEGIRFLIMYHGHKYWNFPKGKIQEEEKSFQAALRETQEETGLKRNDLTVCSRFKTKEQFTFKRKGKKIYKTVIFYLAETKKRYIKLSKEHWGYGWFTYTEALQLFPSEKHKDTRRVLRQVHNFLSNKMKKNKNKNSK